MAGAINLKQDSENLLPRRALPTSPVIDWLAEQQGERIDLEELITGFCAQLEGVGVPIARLSISLPALHPQMFVRGLFWTRGDGAAIHALGHDILSSADFRDSPVALIHAGAAAIRRRLELPTTPRDFPVLHDLDQLGVTDYICLPLQFTLRKSFISFATDRRGGFSSANLALIDAVVPVLAMRLEVCAMRLALQDLLTVYLGQSAAGQVLGGTVQRGQGDSIEAAIWYSDLRGFTVMSDRMPPRALIALLDDYFDCLAKPIQARGGEILKFIGDGLLAIFPTENGNKVEAATRAVDAAIDAFRHLHDLNQGRALEGGAPLRMGLALHLGDVVYGNIGAADRLDFTVIGRAVNHVSRLEAMTKTIGRPLLASSAIAEVLPERFVPVGRHALRDITDAEELYTLPAGTIDHD